jgi:hypothetical protein
MTDPQFERYTIELLKGIYENIGSKPYDTISGFFTPQFDGAWSLDISETINETGLSVVPGTVNDGFVELVVIHAFAETSPYSKKTFQVFNGTSMHPSCVVACIPDPLSTQNLILQYFSENASSAFTPDSRGIGQSKDIGFPFEIRLYKIV